MNKFDEKYYIRHAMYKDIKSIMQFINDYWKKDHIMSINYNLFEYEYVNGNQVNFILAIEKETDKIKGIFGYILASQSSDYKDIWGSMWKVADDAMPFLGIELAKRAVIITNCRMHIGNGANPNTTVPLRKIFFKEKVEKMQHFYFLNNEKQIYYIAKINNKVYRQDVTNRQSNLILFSNIEEVQDNFLVENVNNVPFKDAWYVNKRYFLHPYYDYQVYGVEVNGKIEALIIFREVEHLNSKALRIVDYIGNHKVFGTLQSEFEYLISKYEYIDFYVFGIKQKYIEEAGFKLKDENDSNIIPNYFEPFLQENVDIWVHYLQEGTTFFKADGDQDRPNQ